MDLFTKFYWVFLVLGGLVGACVAGLIGLAVYWLVNEMIDRFQGHVRRNMATPMTLNELQRKRQEKSAAKRLEIRMDGWARK